MNNHLRSMYNTATAKLKDIISDIDACAITHDGWTSISTESYGTITLHFIDEDWKLFNVVLQTRKIIGQHTAEAIKNNLMEAQVEWGFPTPIATTDNAANELKAFQLLDWVQISCMGHNINLAVKSAVAEVHKLVVRGRKVVQFFHKSSTACTLLSEKQKLLLPPALQGHKLITDVETRWNSTLDMLQRLLEQTAAVHAVLSDPALKGKSDTRLLYTTTDQVNVEAVIDFLKPFKDATLSLSREDEPTLAAVLPVIVKLEGHLSVKESDSGMIEIMKGKALDNLSRRNILPDQKKALLLASLLHPRSKKLNFVTESDRHLAESHLRVSVFKAKNVAQNSQVEVISEIQSQGVSSNTLQEILDQANVLTVPADVKTQLVESVNNGESGMRERESHQPPAKKPKSDVMEWLDEIFFPNSTTDSGEDQEVIINREIDLYLSADSSTDRALSWWKQNCGIFPNVAKIAKQYLCVPASSVPSERVFSLCGCIVNKKRASLAPENVDMLVFLNKNYQKLK